MDHIPTNCCSDNGVIADPVCPFLIADRDSIDPVVENAQHEPIVIYILFVLGIYTSNICTNFCR